MCSRDVLRFCCNCGVIFFFFSFPTDGRLIHISLMPMVGVVELASLCVCVCVFFLFVCMYDFFRIFAERGRCFFR